MVSLPFLSNETNAPAGSHGSLAYYEPYKYQIELIMIHVKLIPSDPNPIIWIQKFSRGSMEFGSDLQWQMPNCRAKMSWLHQCNFGITLLKSVGLLWFMRVWEKNLTISGLCWNTVCFSFYSSPKDFGLVFFFFKSLISFSFNCSCYMFAWWFFRGKIPHLMSKRFLPVKILVTTYNRSGKLLVQCSLWAKSVSYSHFSGILFSLDINSVA